MIQIADVDYKKVLIADVAPDGGLGTAWEVIQGMVRQGTASLTGSDADITAHKNVLGGTIKSSKVAGDNNFNFQCADISAANRAKLMGGTVETGAEGDNWKAPVGTQNIMKSIMVVGRDNTIDYAVNVNLDAYLARADDDLAYLQVNGLIEQPTKEGVESQGSWDSVNADANLITAFSIPEETGAAVITPAAFTVAIEVASGTDPSALVPTIGVSLGADITPNSNEAQDFTAPVEYIVNSANNDPQIWTVTVTVAA